MKQYLYLAAIAALLAGCSDNGGSSSNQNPEPTMDSFIAFVSNLVGNTSETADAEAIDSVDATTSETTEAVPLM